MAHVGLRSRALFAGLGIASLVMVIVAVVMTGGDGVVDRTATTTTTSVPAASPTAAPPELSSAPPASPVPAPVVQVTSPAALTSRAAAPLASKSPAAVRPVASVPSQAAVPLVVDVPRSIAADCSRPVDAEVNRWLAGVPNGATARFASGGCYAQAGEFRLIDRRDLLIDGNGASFKAVTDAIGSQRRQWHLIGGQNITLTNMVVVGRLGFRGPYTSDYYPADEWQHGMSLQGVQNIRIEEVKILDVLGDFVEAGPDTRTQPWTPTRDLTLTKSWLQGSGRQGVSVTHGERVTVADSFLGNVNMNVIDLEADEPFEIVRDVTVRGNQIGALRFSFLANAGQGGRGNIGRVQILDNTMQEMPTTCQPSVLVTAPDGSLRDGYTVRGNTFLAYQHAVSLTGVSTAVIDTNRVDTTAGNGGCDRDWGVGVFGSDGVSITGNTFNNVSAATRSDNSSNLSAADNRIRS